MNVQAATMQVDYWDARQKYLEYRSAVKKQALTDPLGARKGEYETLRRAFQAISCGKKVLDINMAIAGAGLNGDGLPRLAVARADWPFVNAWWHERRCVFSSRTDYGWSGRARAAAHNIAVRFPGQRPPNWEVTGRAQVPMIPPAHRPAVADLSPFRILFEAVWERKPPVDPILLRHLKGPFFVVLAQWDLSPLEQAVLRAKL